MSGDFGYKLYRPNTETRYWLERAQAVLVEYQDELPLTVRQIFYRLVASDGYDKTEKAYGKLAKMLTRARRASIVKGNTCPNIPFAAIRDDKLRARQAQFFEDADSFAQSIRDAAESYLLDHQEGQPRVIEMWCEAQGMMPVLDGIAAPYSIRVSSSGGYDSITTKHNLAQRVAERAQEQKLPTLLLHVGDFDGSGEDMFMNMEKDVGTMVYQLTGSWDWFECERVALTAEQVIDRNVITAPPKDSDSRSPAFIDRNWEVVEWKGDEEISAQLEALTPTDLRNLFEDVITGHLDLTIYEALLKREENEASAFATKLAEADLSI